MVTVHVAHPVVLLRSVLAEHIPQVWITPDQIAWLWDRTLPSTPIHTCFADREFRTQIDPLTFDQRMVLAGMNTRTEEERAFEVVASTGPDAAEGSLLLLTATMDLIVATETQASLRNDGVMQIAGKDRGILLLTVDELHEQQGRTLLRGTPLHMLGLRKRGGDGGWEPHAVALRIPIAAGLSAIS